MIKKFILFFGLLPLLNFGQIESAYNEMMTNENKSFEQYQSLVYDASKYLITNPVNTESSEFIAATKLVNMWPSTQSALDIKENSKFYKSLESKNNQNVYRAALYFYFLDQRYNKGELLMGLTITGQNLHEQTDYKKILLGATTLFLMHAENPSNNITLNKDANKYLEAMKKNKLDKMQF